MSENPLEAIFKTFDKISQSVLTQLSKFSGFANHSSPINGRPLFSLTSSFKADPFNASNDSSLLLPKLVPNEGKSATPVTKEELGRSTWIFIHTLAAQYPDNPTRRQKKYVKDLMEILSRMYPCEDCRLLQRNSEVQQIKSCTGWISSLVFPMVMSRAQCY